VVNETWKSIAYMLRENPLVVVGFLLIGIVVWEYLKAGRQHQWSLWPAYLVWPATLIGILCLLTGLFRWR
jgi:protein-S-isoprenylcysteine O-methyltransferase Ste14